MKDIDVNAVPRQRIPHPSRDCEANAHQFLSEVLLNRATISEGRLRWWSGQKWQAFPDRLLEPLVWQALTPAFSRWSVVKETMCALKRITHVNDVRDG